MLQINQDRKHPPEHKFVRQAYIINGARMLQTKYGGRNRPLEHRFDRQAQTMLDENKLNQRLNIAKSKA